jgi:hypothetical protein
MSGKAVIAMPATVVAMRDAGPERNSPRTPRDRVRMIDLPQVLFPLLVLNQAGCRWCMVCSNSMGER